MATTTTNNYIANGTPITAVITLTSLASASLSCCRQGNIIDFGVQRDADWMCRLQTKPAVAPAAGASLLVYMAFSSSSTAFPMSVATTGDALYQGPDGNPADAVANLDMIGVMGALASAVSHDRQMGPFCPTHRYGIPLVFNNWAQALSSTAGDHVLSFTPIDSVSLSS